MRLRPAPVALWRRELPFRGLDDQRRRRAVHRGLERRPAASYLIDDIHRVALPQEILRPAFASVRRPREVGAGLGPAVNHDNGPWVRALRRNLEFRVELAAEDRTAVDRRVLAAGEQI